MKKKVFLIPLPAITLIGTTLSPLSSCASQKWYTEEAIKLRKIAVDEFLQFIKIPHPTFKTRKICDYFKQWLTKEGYQEVSSSDMLPNGKYFKEDSYRSSDVENSSGNLIFNIPATKECEQWTGITLQGHMDMVLDGFEPGHELDQGVKPVIEQDIMHTEGYKTSLGADCGAGLSLILALTKQPNIVRHGPIRCVFTTDEEDGISGASHVSVSDIKYPFLINLDGEDDKVAFISAAGTILSHCEGDVSPEDITPISPDEHEYEIEILGLTGGHSANEINNNIPNAIMLAQNIMSYFSGDASFKISSFITKEGATNAIASHVTFRIVTTAGTPIIDMLLLQRKDDFLKKFPSQTGLDIVYKEIRQHSDVALSNKVSNNFSNFLSMCLYGPISWLDLERKEVETSSNVGPLTIDLSSNSPNKSNIQIDFLSRSCYESSLALMYSYYSKIWSTYMPDCGNCSITAMSPPWEANPNNKLVDLTKEANEKMGFDVQYKNIHGWLECGYFYLRFATQENPLQMVSLGAKLDNVHSKLETWHLDTFLTVIRQVLYCLEHIKNINI